MGTHGFPQTPTAQSQNRFDAKEFRRNTARTRRLRLAHESWTDAAAHPDAMIVAALLYACAFVALTIVVLLVTSYAFFCNNVRKVRHIPGPKPSWPIGNADLLRVDGKPITFLELYNKLAQEYGDVFVFWMGCTPNVVTVSASHPLLCTVRLDATLVPPESERSGVYICRACSV